MFKLKLSLVLLLFIPFNLYSQTMSFSEVKRLISNSLSEDENILIDNGFEYIKVDKINENCNIIWFSYNRKGNATALAFISMAICNENKPLKVFFQIHQKEKYLSLKKQAESEGYKIIKTTTDDDGTLRHLYKKSKDIIDQVEFLTGPDENKSNSTVYIVIYTKFQNK